MIYKTLNKLNMKTQNWIGSIFILVLFINCSKENPPEITSTEGENSVEKKEVLAVPGNLISLEKAKEQLDFYNASHPQEVGAQYALRTWISIDELKTYIAYIEQSSKDKGIAVSGIDIIHTQYKKSNPGSPNANNSVYDKTLMLAPTYKNGTKNVAFDPIYSQQGKPKDLKILLEEIKNDTISVKDGGIPMKSSIANGMSSCPNNCS